ncbi:MAG: beta-galactosidase [Candidatus Nanopelagicales bacterium]
MAWPALPGLILGADYNPEQWPRAVWDEDRRLMREAGFTLATVAVFGWAQLEPEPGRYDLDWLGDVLDGLHEAGVAVDLATATASPPPWLARVEPDSLPVDREGRTRWPGARQAYCPSSPGWRGRGLALVERLADRFGGHPALRLWHVGNEYGCHTAACYCDRCAGRFRAWLAERYGDVDALNEAWATAFWSQRYSDLEDVLPPRITPNGTFANPTQQLDYRRFSDDLLLESFVAERDLLHERSPGIPVTTNFMVMTRFNQLDYWRWAAEVDVVSTDFYPEFAAADAHVEQSFSDDVTRGLAGGDPWMLMETSTSAVNWQPRNRARRPGELLRSSLAHVARGGDAVMFFQWRASRGGAEKYHSGLVPHAGADTRVWREVVELGRTLQRLGEVRGSRVPADVALVWDWQAWWGVELDSHPSQDVTYPDRALAWYRALWDRSVPVDVVPAGADLSAYRLVVVPTLYLVTDEAAEALGRYVEAGGHVLVTYFSGIVDERDQVRLGGYPGAFRDMLGIRVEEFGPLLAGERVRLSDGGTADVWTEDLGLRGAEAVVTYVDGPLPGVPALTRHGHGAGVGWYAATRTDDATTARWLERMLIEAGVTPPVDVPAGVEAVRRSDHERSWLFLLNHTDDEVAVEVRGTDLVTGQDVGAGVSLPAGGVAVVRESVVPGPVAPESVTTGG